MSIGIGVIGAGVMGSDHARIVRTELSGARLVAVADADTQRAAVAAGGAAVFADGAELIALPEVEAVIVASPDRTHAGYVLAAIAAGKPVLCEKPLAPDVASCRAIIAAERAAGRALVHNGFMRRYDPTYREMKRALASGRLGGPRILHNRHRNVSAAYDSTAEMAICNSFVHEIDASRWLLGTEFTAVSVLGWRDPRTGRGGDPLIVTLEAADGTLVSTEVFLNATYGYHVDAELVCAEGTIRMGAPALTATRLSFADGTSFPENWIPRFAEAYRIQDQAFVDAVARGTIDAEASTSRDGFMATYVAEKAVEAWRTGARVVLETDPS
jgi:myo-inositol 2-dehydrogenase/D-chiro-inositol 1-dehydrogenase